MPALLLDLTWTWTWLNFCSLVLIWLDLIHSIIYRTPIYINRFHSRLDPVIIDLDVHSNSTAVSVVVRDAILMPTPKVTTLLELIWSDLKSKARHVSRLFLSYFFTLHCTTSLPKHWSPFDNRSLLHFALEIHRVCRTLRHRNFSLDWHTSSTRMASSRW